MPERVLVVGVVGGRPAVPLGRPALVVGGRRHLDAVAPDGVPTLALGADLGPALDAIGAEPGPVCVLGSGDPGFFGIVRALAERFGPAALEVHPAPSSVALAFARLGLPWDDATVVSAHGRPLAEAARRAAVCAKAAVLVGPEAPPEALGKELVALGARPEQVAVCSRLGYDDERVDAVTLEELAGGTWDPLAVVVLVSGTGVARAPVPSWGGPESAFARRQGMITKAEVRAVALAKLDLPPSGVVWDVGAGSGSVAVECASLAPSTRVFAVERRPDDAQRIRANAAGHGAIVEVVVGSAPEVLADLPDPDRAFVGGGGLAALDAVLARLRPGGRVVATYAAMDRAVAAHARLGHLVQVAVNRAEPLGGGLRLIPENPVFLAWGPPA
ncbi:MAG: precorrin-6y C5,15-methyltransferase (decarboxylating) subunit CbiE [Actinomycetota bacterium]|nr:precorrin-6y C5,15-methyltransferase (decarboxylating) subunit CbiE [Actinomycetota bacterium]